jgi:small subunit ribosomal protein S21
MEVTVNDNNVDHALRALKRKMQREGIYRDMKRLRHYEKPSEKKARKRLESLRRAKKPTRPRFGGWSI